ncbi:hypothetical protein LOZ44_003632 [Ophidiomyces ophidiicola]|nr:hypothetical protein LOZ44_003632 [Ophidiomyces ophidiicola]
MPFSSPFPPLQIPKVDLLSYLFPPNTPVSEKPIWIDAEHPENCLSPRQLLQWVRRLAFGLDRLGVKPGEVVVTLTPNHIFVPVAFLGIVGSRRLFSGISPSFTANEVAYQLRDTEAQALLVHPSVATVAIEAAQKVGLGLDRVFLFSDEPCNPIQCLKDWRSMIGTTDQGQQWTWVPMTEQESQSALATVNYSSGTTGFPKGVKITRYNIIANIKQSVFARFLYKRNRPQERFIGLLPLYHAYGQLFTISMVVPLNIPVYVMKEFNYEAYLRHIQTYRITNLQIAPPILLMLIKRPETVNYDLSSVTDALCGAAPVSKEAQNEASQKFNFPISQGWGMTETTCAAMSVLGGMRDDTGSVGQLIPNTEAKLINDDGCEVGDNEPGELYIRGPQVCLGYWKNEEATAETISTDGWLKTGDIAVVRNGRFWIVDRKKELIKVNGFQVAPAELEAVLSSHEDIEDAGVVRIILFVPLEAASKESTLVLTCPSSRNGEEYPRAYIQLQPNAKGKITPGDIHHYLSSRIARHKQLAGGISFVDAVPRLASGKIVRKLLREWAVRDADVLEKEDKAKL